MSNHIGLKGSGPEVRALSGRRGSLLVEEFWRKKLPIDFFVIIFIFEFVR